MMMMDSLQSQPEWAGFSPRPPRSRSWRQPRAPALQPWPAGSGPDRPYKATLQDADLWSPPDPTSPAPLQLRYSSLQKPHTLKQHLINIILTFMLWIKKTNPSVRHEMWYESSISQCSLTLFCDAVHHRLKHQHVSAAVSTATQPTVTAQTCRTNTCPTRAHYILERHWRIISIPITAIQHKNLSLALFNITTRV